MLHCCLVSRPPSPGISGSYLAALCCPHGNCWACALQLPHLALLRLFVMLKADADVLHACRGHRLVLASRSDYFRALLDHAAAESAERGDLSTASAPTVAESSAQVGF